MKNNIHWLYLIAKIFKNRKSKEYIDNHLNLDDNYNIVSLIKGKHNNEEIFGEIVPNSKNDGFFASIRWALDGLYFCDYYAIKPIIKFADNSLYFDFEYGKQKNPFEYYYEQPFKISSSKLDSTNTIIKITKNNFKLAENLNNNMGYQVSDEYIDTMALIMNKYLKFNVETQNKINEDLKEKNLSEEILGVHIRGTDYKKSFKNHPIYVDVESYYDYIDHALNKYKFKKIFLATDDLDILDKVIDHYGEDMVIYSKNIKRGKGTVGVHIENSNRQFNQYLLGLEVIFDMCSLAECGGIISGMSQVGLVARIYKKSQKKNFLYDQVINKGINKNGKNFKI